MTIAVVLGTRPEIIKLAPIVRQLGPVARIVYTGQHYDEALAGSFFDAFAIPRPADVVAIGGMSRGEQIGEATSALTRLLTAERPDAVVVQGDTNTVLAGALAANALEIPLVHVEAGLRSHDRAMPEEHNRVLTDHLADLCLAPTKMSRDNLYREGITAEIVVTGNTVVEAVLELLPEPDERRAIVAAHGLEPGGYILSTIHRPENTDNAQRLLTILNHLQRAPLPVVIPAHPRTTARIDAFGLDQYLDGLQMVPPMDYRTFLALSAESALLVSDSGGVQEEASIYKRPLIVVRNSTERPEVIGAFAERTTPERLAPVIRARLKAMAADPNVLARIPSPYGNGDAGRLSVKAIEELVVNR